MGWKNDKIKEKKYLSVLEMSFSSLNRCLSLYGWIVSPTVDVSFHFPEWQSCFCPGTGLVSGIQGSRWGPGFLQDQTKLTVIPGILLLQRNESELFVWCVFFLSHFVPRAFLGERVPIGGKLMWICSLDSRSIEVFSKLYELQGTESIFNWLFI